MRQAVSSILRPINEQKWEQRRCKVTTRGPRRRTKLESSSTSGPQGVHKASHTHTHTHLLELILC